jgi:hypothetical protein
MPSRQPITHLALGGALGMLIRVVARNYRRAKSHAVEMVLDE